MIEVNRLYRRRGTGQYWLVFMARHVLNNETRYVCFRNGERLDMRAEDLVGDPVPELPQASDPGVKGWDY